MPDDIIDALEDATDDPPREEIAAETDVTVMPSVDAQLDAANAADNFVRVGIATARHEELDMEADISAASGDGILVTFPDGNRVLFSASSLLKTAAEAVGESEHGPGLDD